LLAGGNWINFALYNLLDKEHTGANMQFFKSLKPAVAGTAAIAALAPKDLNINDPGTPRRLTTISGILLTKKSFDQGCG
jgi:hypothetical protein